jgi:hypothetical protein
MGGFGSGRPRIHRDVCEEVPRIDVRQLHRAGYLAPGSERILRWSGNHGYEEFAELVVGDDWLRISSLARSNDGEYELIEQAVVLTTSNCHVGGARLWMACPVCTRRCAVLTHYCDLYCCRKCSQMPYQTQRMNKHQRLVYRRNRLRERLEKLENSRCWNITRRQVRELLGEAENDANNALLAHWESLN